MSGTISSARARDHGGPREVEALGRVDVVREERVDALRHDHLPVDQRPHEEALVGAEGPDDGPLGVGQGRKAEEGDRAGAVQRQRGDRAPPRVQEAHGPEGTGCRSSGVKRSGRPEWTARFPVSRSVFVGDAVRPRVTSTRRSETTPTLGSAIPRRFRGFAPYVRVPPLAELSVLSRTTSFPRYQQHGTTASGRTAIARVRPISRVVGPPTPSAKFRQYWLGVGPHLALVLRAEAAAAVRLLGGRR